MVTKHIAKSTRQPAGYWGDTTNQLSYLRDLGQKLGYVRFDDWYSISKRDFKNNGGEGMLPKFNHSPSKAVMTLLHGHKWEPWKFHRTSRSYWEDKGNQVQFVEYLGEQLGYKKKSDFYEVTIKDFQAHGGNYLISKYGSIHKLLSSVLGGEWQAWRFTQVSPGFWADLENCLSFMKSLGTSLGYQKMEDWYGITEKEIAKHGGATLLHKFGDSPSDLVRHVFSDHEWLVWKFKKLPQAFFRSKPSLLEYFKYLEKQLHIEEVDDWYRVSLRQIAAHGSVSFAKHYGGLYGALSLVYPQHVWHRTKTEKILSTKKAIQRWLLKKLREIFPQLPYSAFEEEFVHPNLKYANSNEPITIDVHIAPLRLALEYHGTQHYIRSKSASLLQQQKLDAEKQQAFENLGFTFIVIPHWWDLSLGKLAATIAVQRPDLISGELSQSQPIPPHPRSK
eukprot:Phypoly_transcript_07456.p1 GENE.Phypoly_transcript_07456~~Phypoly_transcript_07456.p1  ORF type:complete len:448 (+),score=49.37 Phypoly_transcript_07456:69-1412(+)